MEGIEDIMGDAIVKDDAESQETPEKEDKVDSEPSKEPENVPDKETKVEEKAEEPEKEADKEEKKEDVESPEKPTEPEKEAEPAEPEKPEYNLLGEVNKALGKDFKDIDSLRSLIEEKAKVSEVAKEVEEARKANDYYKGIIQELAKQADPLAQYEGDEKAYKAAYVARKIKGSRSETAVNKVVKSCINGDIDKMSDLDVLALETEFDVPGKEGRTKDIKESILKSDLGVDFEKYEEEKEKSFDVFNPDLESDQDIRLGRLAAKARTRLKTMVEGVEMPEKKDIMKDVEENWNKLQEKQQRLEQSWEVESKRIADSLTEIKEPGKKDGFVLEVSPEFRAEAQAKVKDFVVARGYEPTRENVEAIIRELQDIYISEVGVWKVADMYSQKKLAEQQEAFHSRVHSDKPLNKDEKPEPAKKSEEEALGDALKEGNMI